MPAASCCRLTPVLRQVHVFQGDGYACLYLRQRSLDSRRPSRSRAAAGPGAGSSAGSGSSGSTARGATKPCHYETLGVPRSATRADVKRAFRRLARLWHPDVNPSPAATERFQAIARAFEVLSDEQRRTRYDAARWGPASRSRSSSRARHGTAHGAPPVEQPPPDVYAVLQLDFREAALGMQRSVDVRVVDECHACHGTGAAAGTAAAPCPMCKGRREIRKRQRVGALSSHNHEAGQIQFTVCCPVCAGRGFSPEHPCACCSGEGLVRQLRRVTVQVPAGAEDGGRLRLAGEGDVARVGGPRGGVVFELQVAQEEGMWRDGLDLHSQLAVPLWDALLGGTATVSTLRGAASLTIPPGTQHGTVLSLAHAGLESGARAPQPQQQQQQHKEGQQQQQQQPWEQQHPRRGSHHFTVLVQLPRDVSSKEQALLQRLAVLQRQRQQGERCSSGGSSSSSAGMG